MNTSMHVRSAPLPCHKSPSLSNYNYPTDPLFNVSLYAGFAKERGGQIAAGNVLELAKNAEAAIRLLQAEISQLRLAGKAVC
jgi:hypothetical protein